MSDRYLERYAKQLKERLFQDYNRTRWLTKTFLVECSNLSSCSLPSILLSDHDLPNSPFWSLVLI